MDSGVVSILTKLIEAGVFGDWTLYLVLLLVGIYALKQIGSPFQRLFDSITKKEDLKEIENRVNSIEKSVEHLENILDNNLDVLKLKVDTSVNKVEELEKISKGNKLELDGVMRELQYTRNALDNISIKIRSEK